MAADINEMKLTARMLAELKFPNSLVNQRGWLETEFQLVAGQAMEGSMESTNLSLEGSSSTFQYRGSTPEERAAALRRAITEIRAEIAAADAGVDPRPPAGVIYPRFIL
jgi:hypothetical protein